MQKKYSFIISLFVAFSVIFGNNMIIVQAQNGILQFEDDFSADTALWSISNNTMLIPENENVLTTDNTLTNCMAEIGKGNTEWSDFELYLDVKFEQTDSSGVAKLILRKTTNAFLGLIIRPDVTSGFRSYSNLNGETIISGDNATIEYGKIYTLKVVASGAQIDIYYKLSGADAFTYAGYTACANTSCGQIGIGAYMQKCIFDNVKVYNTACTDFYFADKLKAVCIGNTENFLPVNTQNLPVTYVSSNESVATVNNNGEVDVKSKGCAVITATAVKGNGSTCSDSFTLIGRQPVRQIGFNTYNITMYEGDVLNINAVVLPTDATNQRAIWSSSDTDKLDVSGSFYTARSLIAKKASDDDVYVTVRSLENGAIRVLCVQILPRSQQENSKQFAVTQKTPIPENYFGVDYYDPMMLAFTTTDRNVYIARDELSGNVMKDLGFQHIRWILGNYKILEGKLPGVSNSAPYTLSDMYKNANELDIPMCVAACNTDTAEEIIETVQEISLLTDKTIYLEMPNEAYNIGAAQYFPTVEDFIEKTRAVYTGIQQLGINAKVAVPMAEAYLWEKSKAAYEINPKAGTQAERITKWNNALIENSDCYDAVVFHLYSNVSLEMCTKEKIMNNFSLDAEQNLDNVSIMKQYIPDKEFWITEYGDLPNIFGISQDAQNGVQSESERSRIQYMKSLGNSIGYANRLLKMLDDTSIKLAAYHILSDTQGFGLIQPSADGGYDILPPYYVFDMLGDVFAENDFYYGIGGQNELSATAVTGEAISYSRINAFGFGDNSEMNCAVFTNTSAEATKVNISGKLIHKKWQYSDNDPLPDFGRVTSKSWLDMPSYVPTPQSASESEYFEQITLPPYSVVLADVKENAECISTVFDAELLKSTCSAKKDASIAISFTAAPTDGLSGGIEVTDQSGNSQVFTQENDADVCRLIFTEGLRDGEQYKISIADSVTYCEKPIVTNELFFSASDSYTESDFSNAEDSFINMSGNCTQSQGKALFNLTTAQWGQLKTAYCYGESTFEFDITMSSGSVFQTWLCYNNTNGNNGFNIFFSPDASDKSRSVHTRLFKNGTAVLGDTFLNNPGYIFESGENYRIRIVKSGKRVSIYAKKIVEEDFTLAGFVENDAVNQLGDGIIWMYSTAISTQLSVDNIVLKRNVLRAKLQQPVISSSCGAYVDMVLLDCPQRELVHNDIVFTGDEAPEFELYNAGNNKYRLIFTKGLTPGITYSFNLSNSLKGAGESTCINPLTFSSENTNAVNYELRNVYIKNSTGNIVANLGGIENEIVNVCYNLRSYVKGTTPHVVCALYDGASLKKVLVSEADVSAFENEKNCIIPLQMDGTNNNAVIKLFVMNSMTNLVPESVSVCMN